MFTLFSLGQQLHFGLPAACGDMAGPRHRLWSPPHSQLSEKNAAGETISVFQNIHFNFDRLSQMK